MRRIALAGMLAMAVGGGGCAMFQPKAEAPHRARLPARKPVVLWIDWAALAKPLAERGAADAFCAEARAGGFTALAIESVARDGTLVPGSTGPAGVAWRAMADAAPRHGLTLGAIHSAMIAPPETPTAQLVHRAIWSAGGDAVLSTELAGAGSPPRRSLAMTSAVDGDVANLARVAADPAIAFVLIEGLGFHDLQADFSPVARTSFEAFAGVTMRRWPQDVLGEAPPLYPLDATARGPGWDAWLTWRAEMARRYLVTAKAAMLGLPGRPPELLVLVDAPYPGHLREGLNWAHPLSTAAGDFPWLPEGYGSTAAGHLIDGVVLGLWEPRLMSTSQTEQAGYAWWSSMEASSAAAARYGQTGSRVWGAVPVGTGDGWTAATRAAWELNGGVVLISGGTLRKSPGGLGSGRQAWQ